MTTTNNNANSDIIIAMTKLGVYLERDKRSLAKLTPVERNELIRTAFDRAIENCCIYPMLFEKRNLVMGRLVLSDKPEWEGWREAKDNMMREKALQRRAANVTEERQITTMRAWVECLGTHSIWAPFRMGRYSVENSAKVQGASIRLKDDVPELETLIMRWLMVANGLDIFGQSCPGFYWAITDIPAKHNQDNIHLPIPPSHRAVLAVQSLNVFQIDLQEDIDSVEDETGEKEMRAAGYRGNKNRRAIPIIVVRYATSLPTLGSQKNVKSFISYANMPSQDAGNSYLTSVQYSLFSRLLESNSRRLAPSEIKKYQANVPKHIRKETSISFLSPVFCPSADLADQLEINRKSALACAVCLVHHQDSKLFFCSACSGVTYCSTEHQTKDWPAHKVDCRPPKSSSDKVPIPLRADSSDNSSSVVKALFPLRRLGFDMSIPGYGTLSNPMDRVKPMSKSSARSQCSKTIYGPGERFLVCARWGGHADSYFGVQETDRLSGSLPKAPSDVPQDMLDFHMSVIFILDRPLSFSILIQKQTGHVGKAYFMPDGFLGKGRDEFDQDNTIIFEAMVNIIKKSRGGKAEAAFFWATRKGDCVEVDLQNIPDQSLGW